ncbi:hypothetical protein ACOSP7_030627 [Xanthoceras sorbifolium]
MSSRSVFSSYCWLIFSFFCMQFVVDAVTDRISQGQGITHSQSLKVSDQTIVWVANRDQPLKSNSAVLTINNEGNLVIVDGIITYRVAENSLRQNTNIMWQSFDYPSNTLLPGMKVGYSRKTGKVWSITSWKDADDPDLGAVELKMDPNKPNELFLMRGSQMVWRSGIWLSHEGTFSLMAEMRVFYYLKYRFHEDENETYFTFSLVNSSSIVRYLLDISGQFKQMNWLEAHQGWFMFWPQPRDACNIYSYCGSFVGCSNHSVSFCRCLRGFRPSDSSKQLNPSIGCVRRMPLQCEDSSSVNGDEDRFLTMNNVKFPFSPKESKLQAVEECKLACFNDCACTTYAYNGTAVCSLWDGDLLSLTRLSEGDPDGQTIYLKLAASEFQNHGGEKKLILVIAIVVVVEVLLLLTSFIGGGEDSKRKEMERSQDRLLLDINMSTETSTSELSNEERAKGKSNDSWLPLFSFSSVSAATNNFSIENKLGEGGFGPIYKGNLLNGQEVAVKRLLRKSGQGLEELKNETMLIAKLQHRNLVRLLGCCIDHGEKILIYEFIPNKSLDSFLFGLLDWETCVRFVEGIARRLLYLHHYSRLRIIHRDLKASNILLDGLFSIKSDVFSLGVLLLETLSSKKNTGFYNTDSLNLLGHAWEMWNNDRALDLMDPILENEASFPMLIRYINVALLCVQEIAVH